MTRWGAVVLGSVALIVFGVVAVLTTDWTVIGPVGALCGVVAGVCAASVATTTKRENDMIGLLRESRWGDAAEQDEDYEAIREPWRYDPEIVARARERKHTFWLMADTQTAQGEKDIRWLRFLTWMILANACVGILLDSFVTTLAGIGVILVLATPAMWRGSVWGDMPLCAVAVEKPRGTP